MQRPLGLQMSSKAQRSTLGFTIVELLIVVVVIAILAAITIVAYNGITAQAKETSLKSDLRNTATKLAITQMEAGSYPATLTQDVAVQSQGNELTYTGGGNEFCLQATNGTSTFYTTQGGTVQEGVCPLEPVLAGDFMQTVTKDRCPEERIVVRDARDNHTYFIQKLADGQCWMLTNLAYAGGTSNGGTSTYGDIISTDILVPGVNNYTYTEATYYIHPNANPTTYPVSPSTSTDGGATNPQYGYLYNWCAAMGAQTSTSACANAATPTPDPTVSICPEGWRLPTSTAANDELALLTSAIGAISSSTGSTKLRSTWLAQYSGHWLGGFGNQGTNGTYWSSTQYLTTNARYLSFSSFFVLLSNGVDSKLYNFSVRCLAT